MKKYSALISIIGLIAVLFFVAYFLINDLLAPAEKFQLQKVEKQDGEGEQTEDQNYEIGDIKTVDENININETNKMDDNKIINKIEKENGLIIEILKEGDGKEAKNSNTVSVHYTGKLDDGTVFDSSIQRGTPIEFNLGIGMVIPGWEQGIVGMLVGEKRILTIPPDLAYGQAGVTAPDGTVVIPGGATLIFEVELVDVK